MTTNYLLTYPSCKNGIMRFLFFLCFIFKGYTQNLNNKQVLNEIVCPTENLIKNLSPKHKKAREEFEKIYKSKIKTQKTSLTSKGGQQLYHIPTVIHVLHDGSSIGSTANRTSSSITNIINQANQRFRHQQPNAPNYSNPYYGVDTEIEMCLATSNPSGGNTTGIVRHFTPEIYNDGGLSLLDIITSVKWDTNRYLNIFIAPITDASGYYIGGDFDVVVIKNSAFWAGLTNHEVGHYFSLKHTFNGSSCTNGNCLTDGDFVCDTPPKNSSGLNGGSCASPANTCTTDEDDTSTNNPYRAVALGGMGDQVDMLANYMDYTAGCWNSFTQGQKDRMRINIENARSGLLISNGCNLCVGYNTDFFPVGTLSHTGTGSNSTNFSFTSNRKDVNFTVSSINSNLSGNPRNQYNEEVTISYVDGNGNTVSYGTFINQSSIDVLIDNPAYVREVIVSLRDAQDGSSGNSVMQVSLSSITSCAPENSCANNGGDTDGDGVCADVDCNDNEPNIGAIGTTCNDNNACTTSDQLDANCNCVGIFEDSDNDGICDANDICPGGDDSIDSDNDGTPDFCDCNILTNAFNPNTLEHVGAGSTSVSITFASPVNTVDFEISNLNASTNGKPSQRFIDSAEVRYIDSDGNTIIHGTYSGDNQNTASISIPAQITQVTVTLSDSYDGNSPSISINLSNVTSCSINASVTENNIEYSIDSELNANAVGLLPSDISIFPNPASDKVNVLFHTEPEAFYTIQLKNVLGQTFYEQRIKAFEKLTIQNIETSVMDAGIYFIIIQSNNKHISKRLIIK